MKKGITVVSVSIILVVIMMLVGTITVSSYNSIQNAKKITFSLEISNIQEKVDRYMKKAEENDYPIADNTYTLSLSDISGNSIGQFESEAIDSNIEVVFYELDLEAIGIEGNQYGNKKTDKDVYVLSKETKKVYYLEGLKVKDMTYYTLTEELIDIKKESDKVKEENQILSKPHINTVGAVEKTLATGEKEVYVSGIDFTGENIKVAKYEKGIIDEKSAKDYFNTHGNTIVGDRIRLPEYLSITLYVENSKGEYDIKYRGYPKIPEGFVASDLEDEDEVSEGLVIYEGREKVSTDEDAQTTRNQFVWIPVQDINEFQNVEGYSSEGVLQSYLSQIREPYLSGYTNEVAEYNAMKEGIEKYGGFYIGRYEAGTTNARLKQSNGTTDVVVQKGKNVYNFVGWGSSTKEIEGTVISYDWSYDQGKGAVLLCKELYISEKYNDIVCTLTYGVQWDSMLKFIQNIKNINADNKSIIENSTGYGIYGVSTLGLTGSSEKYKIKNMYDIAGNAVEWTMEYGRSGRIYRGGHFVSSSGFESPVSNRGNLVGNVARDYIAFRPALYLK